MSLQKIICYVNADSPVGTITDSSSQALTTQAPPMIVRGIDALLCVRLRRDGTKYPASELAFDVWNCDFCNDWSDATPPSMVADNDNIALVETEEYTELQIPLLDSNTDDIVEKISGTDEIKLGLELTGYVAGDAKAKFALQFDLKIRNRRNMTGQTPSGSIEEYWNITQTKAYVALAPVFQFSVDGATDWHSTQVDADRYYREQRNGGEWSDAIALIEPTDAFVYVAYASDDSGTDFNLTPSDTLKYRAEIHVTEEIAAPAASDFSGATWVKYIGDSITGDIGPQGDPGINTFTYVAYASDNAGTGWSLTPVDSLKYRAEIHSTTELTPVESDFSGATWVQYIGDPATGVSPQGTYASGTTYALNEGVTYNGSYYRSLAADNTGNQPDTNPTYWEKMISIGKTGTNILTAISGFSYLFPDPDFTDYANTANIEPNRGDYGADAALISTSSNEPMGYPLRKIPADAVSLKFREVFGPENGYGWNGETVVFKGEFKKMTNNAAWGSVTSVDIGTFTAPAAETPTGDTTTDSAIITNMSDTSNLVAGMLISGSGIPAGATIVSVDSGTQITISGNATATASTVSLTSKSVAPQLYESTVSLATLGLAVGDVVNFVQRIDSTSTWANDIALELGEIEVITS